LLIDSQSFEVAIVTRTQRPADDLVVSFGLGRWRAAHGSSGLRPLEPTVYRFARDGANTLDGEAG
jgi:hypothetical protein